MKKLIILGAALLALGFVSCDEENTLGIPQENPQGPVLEGNGIEVRPEATLQGENVAVDLSDAKYATNGIPVMKLASQDALYDNSAYLVMQVATSADFAETEDGLQPYDIEVSPEGTVSVADWDKCFRELYGKGPKAKPMYVRFEAYANYNGQKIRIGGVDNYYYINGKEPTEVTVTPIPLEIFVDTAYYLIGTCNDWKLNTDYPFNHSAEDVYDDPIFYQTVIITDQQASEGWWWKIASQNSLDYNDWDTVIGTENNGDLALSGKLVDTNAQAGCIKEAGKYLFVIDMMSSTYKFEKVEPYLYTPGNSNGWSHDASQKLAYDDKSATYRGFAVLDGEYKFSNQPNWDGTNYGSGDADGTISTTGGNLKADGKSLYWLTVNTANLTYTITKISSIGAIGMNNNWDNDAALTPSEDLLIWTGDVTFGGANNWKFRCNGEWAVNLGGSPDDLVLDGGNMPEPGAGLYTVTLDLSKIPYTCTTVAK